MTTLPPTRRWTAALAATALLTFTLGCADADPADDTAALPANTAEMTTATVTDTMVTADSAAAAFDRWMAMASQPGMEHEYTANGLRGVADVLEARSAGTTGDIAARVTELRQAADAIQQDPTATTHALRVREAFIATAGAFRQLTDSAITAPMMDAATGVSPDQPLLEQTDAVRRFFQAVSDAM